MDVVYGLCKLMVEKACESPWKPCELVHYTDDIFPFPAAKDVNQAIT